MKALSICVVGGNGKMGRLLARTFRQAGYRVEVADTGNGPVSWESVARHEVVILAVPLRVFEEVVRSLGPFTRTDGAVIDISSLKEAPLGTMLEHCRGEVIGCHPLFGPAVPTLKGQTVFVCPGRTGGWYFWFRAFLEECGAQVADIDPRRHDELMSFIQVLRHLLLFCFGKTLERLDFNSAEESAMLGPWFSTLLEMLERQVEMEPELCADIALSNPQTSQVVSAFASSVQEMCGPYLAGDRDALISRVRRIGSWWSEQQGRTGAGLPPVSV